MSDAPLVCPGCATPAPAGERFCEACGMPLVFAGVKGGSEAEAELIQGLLLEHGVPSMYKRSAGFDVPDMLFSGPRDVFVPQSGEAVAREVLSEVEAEHASATARAVAAGQPPRARAGRSTRTMAVGLSLALGLLSIVPATVLLSRAFG